MADLYQAFAVLMCLSALAMSLTQRISRRLSRATVFLLLILVSGVLALFTFFVQDSLALARLVPIPSIIIWGNLQPILAAMLAGLAWTRMKPPALRKIVLLIPLLGLCLLRATAPLVLHPPPLSDWWHDDVCMQTSDSSCAPAAAATLLRAHGIAATEAEMARLCLTSTRGTSLLGLYRGLRFKTEGTPWTVEPFHCTADQLRSLSPDPVILSVHLARFSHVDPIFETHYGWQPGVQHTVVLFGFDESQDKIRIGDPTVGRETWDDESLRVLFHGDGIRLVKTR